MQLKWKIIWLLGNNLEEAKAFTDLSFFSLFFFLHLVQPSLSSHKAAYDNKASSSPTEGSSVKTQCTLRIREALPPSSCWLGIKVHFTLTFNGRHLESTPYKWHRPWLESQKQFILHPGFPPVVWHKQIWPFFIPSRFKSSRSVILCGWHHEKNPRVCTLQPHKRSPGAYAHTHTNVRSLAALSCRSPLSVWQVKSDGARKKKKESGPKTFASGRLAATPGDAMRCRHRWLFFSARPWDELRGVAATECGISCSRKWMDGCGSGED